MDYLFLSLDVQTPYLKTEDKKRLYAAFCFAKKAHAQQVRKTGEPYIVHPISVACLLTQLKIDVDSLIAALLHDVLEDTEYDVNFVRQQFGKEVAVIVDGVSRLDSLPRHRSETTSTLLEAGESSETNDEVKQRQKALQNQAANFGKLILAMSDDLRVILIKLADRMHNIQTARIFRSDKAQRIARETMDIYVPLAAKIGLNPWRVFLENQCFKILFPNRYTLLLKAMRKIKGDNIEVLNQTIQDVKIQLQKASITVHDIQGREKRPYSLYRKMVRKSLRFRQLMDQFAFRVVVDNVDECYRALGILHQWFKPVPGRFKDYIALPKVNGYQSLHTVLINLEGTQAEFQIRTPQMHTNAEYGIAAHWKYKEVTDTQQSTNTTLNHKWLSNLLEIYEQNPNQKEFFENAKIALLPDEIFVFTPTGELIDLPQESTALDFAYAVHTKVGNHAIEAKINLVNKPLDSKLENGDLVEIITSSFAYPTPEKLQYVTTAKARSTIRNQLNKLQSNDLQALGKELFEEALNAHNMDLRRLSKYSLLSLTEELNLASLEELYYAIGRGQRPTDIVVSQLLDILGEKTIKSRSKEISVLTLSQDMSYKPQYARCCRPICQDEVIGHLSGERGLVVHRRNCPNARNFHKNPTVWAMLSWQSNSMPLTTRIRVISHKVQQILAQLAKTIASTNTDIEDVQVNRLAAGQMQIDFFVLVSNRSELAQLMKLLRRQSGVTRVSRPLS